MRIRAGLSNASIANLSNGVSIPKSSSPTDIQIGKVYGVITTLNTPTEDLFNAYGGFSGQGTIFYLNYEQSKNTSKVDLKNLQVAKPFFPQNKYYPVLGELVYLIDLPSISSQISNTSSEKYYLNTINIWNNIHHNAQLPSDKEQLGKTFTEKTNINSLQAFEGDYILEGRFGNTLRFGSTNKVFNKINKWSNTGKEGDPITIITNGPKFIPNSLNPYIEDINKDASSIWATSTQQIPLITDKNDILNPLTKPIKVDKYFNSQILLNSDRIVINSKKDEILLFAKTNIELNTKNIINLNSDERVHLNTPKVFLGTEKDGTLPSEPLLLGDKTITLLTDLIASTHEFCAALSGAVGAPEGCPIIDINAASVKMMADLENIMGRLETLTSRNNFTS